MMDTKNLKTRIDHTEFKIKIDPNDNNIQYLNIYQEHLELVSINRQTGECVVRIAREWHTDDWCKL